MSRIIVHACCAHCTAYTIEHFRQASHEVTALWYNPNIHPYMEHQNRLAAMETLATKMSFPLVIIPSYDFISYLRAVSGHENTRCAVCFRLRLQKVSEVTKELGADGFATSLLISPHQDHNLIKGVGEDIATSAGVSFMYADLRKRYPDSRHITKPLELYRQQYCGCIFSEYERFADTKIQAKPADDSTTPRMS